MAPKNREAFILLSQYEKLFYNRYGKKPRINKYRDKWGMQEIIDDCGMERTRELLDYYFRTGNIGHTLQFFYNNYDRLAESLQQKIEDRERRQKLLEQTKRMVENDEH